LYVTYTFGGITMMNVRMNRTLGLLALVAAIGMTGCESTDPMGVNGGRVRFVLSGDQGAPAALQADPSQAVAETGLAVSPSLHEGEGDKRHNPYFATANVTFSSILARNEDGVLVDAGMDLPATIDVVTMEDGRSITLPDGDLPPATYDQVVVVMTQVVGTMRDGTTLTIDPPGGGWTAIVPLCPFVIEEGATAVVGLNLDVGRSFAWRNNRFHFEPRFVCQVAAEEGT
jgi:hypothetical protein